MFGHPLAFPRSLSQNTCDATAEAVAVADMYVTQPNMLLIKKAVIANSYPLRILNSFISLI